MNDDQLMQTFSIPLVVTISIANASKISGLSERFIESFVKKSHYSSLPFQKHLYCFVIDDALETASKMIKITFYEQAKIQKKSIHDLEFRPKQLKLQQFILSLLPYSDKYKLNHKKLLEFK